MSLDVGLEYKKGESQTNIEMKNDKDFERYLQIEEEYLRQFCDEIIALKPDVVLTTKGCVGNLLVTQIVSFVAFRSSSTFPSRSRNIGHSKSQEVGIESNCESWWYLFSFLRYLTCIHQ